MNSSTDLAIPFDDWYLAKGFDLNTNILETNLINLAVVISVLVYFGKGLLSTLLKNRRDIILSTIRTAEERYQEALDEVNRAKTLFEELRAKADEVRVNNSSQVKRENQEMLQAVDEDDRRLEELMLATVHFEEQRAIEEVRQQTCKSALKRALQALNHRLNQNHLQTRMIEHSIILFNSINNVIH